MQLDARRLLLAFFVLVALTTHGLGQYEDPDAPSSDSRDAPIPTSMPFAMEDLEEEAEGLSDEPMTFVYFDEIIEEECRTREIQECRAGEIPECRIREQVVCSRVPTTRRFECIAERKESAREMDGRLGSPIRTESLQACCNACVGVPNGACRSWWRETGSNRRCYNNENR